MIDTKRLNSGEKIYFKNKKISGYVKKRVRPLINSDDVYYAVALFDSDENKWDIHVLGEEGEGLCVLCHYFPSDKCLIKGKTDKKEFVLTYAEFLEAATGGDWKYSPFAIMPPLDDDTLSYIKETVKELQNEYKKGAVRP